MIFDVDSNRSMAGIIPQFQCIFDEIKSQRIQSISVTKLINSGIEFINRRLACIYDGKGMIINVLLVG